MTPRSSGQKVLSIALGAVLLAASILKAWLELRYPQPLSHSWLDGPAVAASIAVFEAAFGLVLIARIWPRRAWQAAVSLFSLFVIITATEALQGKTSCGCFGAVQVRPVYTMSLDLVAVVLLLLTGIPPKIMQNSECRMQNGQTSRERGVLAGALAVVWVGIVLGIWLTRPVVAATAESPAGQDFGNPGNLVVLEPEKWTGQKFSLADHIDIGSQLNTGQWIILLVHHDCDHCAAAVPRYVAAAETQNAEGRMQNEEQPAPSAQSSTPGLLSSFIVPPSSFPQPPPRLAVIEMPPYADPTDPPPWQLPASVPSGHLDQTRDWFATTPVAILIKDGMILAAREGDPAETPDPAWFNRR